MKSINVLSLGLFFAHSACATPYTCDPSALTYETEKCVQKNVFTVYSEAADIRQTNTDTVKNVETPKKDLSKSFDAKLKQLDLSRKTRTQEKNPLTFNTKKPNNNKETNNRGMQTQIEKSRKIQGELPDNSTSPTKRKNAYLGVDLPVKPS